jgi:hypothetical protein
MNSAQQRALSRLTPEERRSLELPDRIMYIRDVEAELFSKIDLRNGLKEQRPLDTITIEELTKRIDHLQSVYAGYCV